MSEVARICGGLRFLWAAWPSQNDSGVQQEGTGLQLGFGGGGVSHQTKPLVDTGKLVWVWVVGVSQSLCSRWREPPLGYPTPKEGESISQKVQRFLWKKHRICSRLQNSPWAVAATSRHYC